jgi:hypothetical protein
MKNVTSPIPIIYQGGSYGTYLCWLLKMLFSDQSLYDPFILEKGNSHNTQVSRIDICKWLEDNESYDHSTDFIKVHAKKDETHSLKSNLEQLTSYFKKSILIYPRDSSYLLHSNNYVYKIWDDLWAGPLKYINLDNLYDNFPVKKFTNPHDVPTYIIREWLSINFFDSMNSQIEWFLPDHISNPNCLILFIDDLLYDLPGTMNKIKNFLQLPYTKNINDILPYHKKNLNAQKFINQDRLATDITESISTNRLDLSWKQQDLTLITEAWIEQWLRCNGYDFKNFQLNNFPTSTAELMKFL